MVIDIIFPEFPIIIFPVRFLEKSSQCLKSYIKFYNNLRYIAKYTNDRHAINVARTVPLKLIFYENTIVIQFQLSIIVIRDCKSVSGKQD